VAGPCQVSWIIATVVLLGNDVLDVKGIEGLIALVQTAVLAALIGT
jgi:hypothetical protein